jgi:hypothetical protein
MKATEPWKDCATKAMSDMSTIGDLGVGEASTSRRARLVLLLEVKLLQIVLREVGVIDDYDEALRVKLVATPHEFYLGLQLLRVVHTLNYVGAVVRSFVIETDRTLDLVDAFALNHVTGVKVDVLESRSNVVFGAAALRANLVFGMVRVRDYYVTMILTGESVGQLVVDVLADQLLHIAVEHVTQPAVVPSAYLTKVP